MNKVCTGLEIRISQLARYNSDLILQEAVPGLDVFIHRFVTEPGTIGSFTGLNLQPLFPGLGMQFFYCL